MTAQSVHVGPRGTIRVVLPSSFAHTPDAQGDTIPDVRAPGEDLETIRTCEAVGAVAQPREGPAPSMPELSHPTELNAGDVFRGYVVAGRFAEGGTAVLYEGTHATSMKRALIKVLKPSYRGPEHETMQRKLLAEGKFLMAAAGRNPYLVPCHDVGIDAGLGPFLIMDKIEGQTLAQHLANQRAGGKTFEPMTVVNLGLSLCVGLQMAHEAGAVHRDLKPANIIVLRSRGGPLVTVIIDWGAAKSTFSPDTRHAPVFGTLAYMSPEQIDRGPITAATDEYALAIVLCELLWRHPFLHETGLTEAQLLARMRFLDPDKPPAAFVPRRLWAILERSLAKNPEHRHGSCEALGAALSSWAVDPDKVEEQVRATANLRPTIPLPGRARQGERTPTPAPTDLVDPAPRLRMDEPSEHASLIVRSGVHAGARFIITGGRVVLGRHPAVAHVVLTDEKVTQRHAALECVIHIPAKPMYSLVDLGSLNGVSVAGVRLSSGPEFDAVAPDSVVIRAGDTFVLGDVEIALAPAGRLGVNGAWETYEEVKASRAAAARGAEAPPDAAPKPKTARPVFRVPLTQKFLSPTLLVEGPAVAARYHLERETVLGSSAERANIVIEDDYVSRAHVRFTHVSGRFGGALTVVADDLESANGMHFRRGDAYERCSSVALHPGMSVSIGKLGNIVLTVLAPGGFSPEAGEFIACDERGRPIETAGATEPFAKDAVSAAKAPKVLPIGRRAGSRRVLLVLGVLILLAATLLCLRYVFHVRLP